MPSLSESGWSWCLSSGLRAPIPQQSEQLQHRQNWLQHALLLCWWVSLTADVFLFVERCHIWKIRRWWIHRMVVWRPVVTIICTKLFWRACKQVDGKASSITLKGRQYRLLWSSCGSKLSALLFGIGGGLLFSLNHGCCLQSCSTKFQKTASQCTLSSA